MSGTSAGREVALVTGASGGIGRAVSTLLVRAGFGVVAFARRADALEQLAADLGPSLLPVVGDVTVAADVDRAVRAAEEAFGCLTVLVNNAGVAEYAAVEAMDELAWRRVLDVNLTGAFLALRAALPALRRAGGGCVVNVASLAAVRPFPGGGAYAASKAGLVALTESAALEVRDDGIRVSVLLPGSVATGMTDAEEARDWKIQPDDVARVVLDIVRLPAHVMPGRIELRPTRVPADRRVGLRQQ